MSTVDRIWRVRLVTASALLVAMAFHQAPGLVVPDTKLDLTADPGGLLRRALSLWDDNGFGQLQNQAYGYLFPMGPFHWLLDAAGLPSWVIQRLWWSTVLVVALWGFWRLATALGVGTPWARYLGALLFAISPRFLAEVTITSIEVWPMALAPWVLIPLVDPAPRSTPSRLARSALAFGLTGGVNAVASGAALVLPTLWFATRGAKRAVLHLFGWLGLCIVAAAWWLVPLLVLGRYSPPFLDWIEDASVTTSTGSIFNALQGTTAWLGFLGQADGPSWPAAWLVVSQPLLVVLTAGIGVLGLVGVADRRLPERSWLVLSLVVGAGLLTLGYSGSGSGPWVSQVQALLDGPLAPLRNLHKFEPVIRIPLLLGAVHAVGLLARHALVRQLPRPVLGGAVALLVVATAAPGVTASLPRPGGYTAIPEHWHEAAGWLEDRATAGSVLVVPASSFADFTWGSTKDEPLQALLDRRAFAVRDAVPLGSAGSTRMLDEIERRLGAGMGSAQLRRTLNEAGVRYVVVRNDLRPEARAHAPLSVHEALAESGISRVASFGPPTGSPFESAELTVNERTELPFPSVEIFDTGLVRSARFVGADSILSVTGGPEDLVSLGQVLPAGAATVMGSDRAHAGPWLDGAPEVLTDGLRRREVDFGRPAGNTSDVLTAADPGRTGRRTVDYVADAQARPTVVQWEGVTAVRASSSASDANSTLRLGAAHGPAAALDGDPGTRWVSGRFGVAAGEWLEVELDEARDVSGLSVLLSADAPVGSPPERVAVETVTGTVVNAVVPGQAWTLRVPPGKTDRVRIRLEATAAGNGNGFAIAELSLPGTKPVARLAMPPTHSGTPDLIVMRQQNPGRSGCSFAGERPLCSSANVQSAEESAGLHRSFVTTGDVAYEWTGSVLPTSGSSAEQLLDFPGRATVRASSSRVPGLAGRAGAVLDRDVGTGWVAGQDDATPTLEIALPEPRVVTELQFLVDAALAGSRPLRVTVTASNGQGRTLDVDDEGKVRLPAVRTDRLTVTFLEDGGTLTADAVSGYRSPLPVGVSELRIEGADDLRTPVDPDWVVGAGCGFGPSLNVNGRTQLTQVSGTVRELLRGLPLAWEPCGSAAESRIEVGAGRHVLDALTSAEFRPHELVLRTAIAVPAENGHAVLDRGESYVVGSRQDAGLLVLPHNYNVGWSATDGAGAPLQGVRVNGWQQGWVIPAGAAITVTPTFEPQGAYVSGLVGGGLAYAALVAFVVLTARRAARGPRRTAPLPPGTPARLMSLAGLTFVLVVNAGAVGAAAGLVALAIALASHRWGWSSAIALGFAGALGTALVAVEPWGRGGAALTSPVVALLMWAALAAAVVGDLLRSRRAPTGAPTR